VHHENPVPAAAGPQMVFTSRAEYTYGIDRKPASHNLGVPDYMKASETTAPQPSKAAYSKTLAEIFSAEWTLNT